MLVEGLSGLAITHNHTLPGNVHLKKRTLWIYGRILRVFAYHCLVFAGTLNTAGLGITLHEVVGVKVLCLLVGVVGGLRASLVTHSLAGHGAVAYIWPL